MGTPLNARRDLLEQRTLPKLGEPIRYSPELQARLADLLRQPLRVGPALGRLPEDAD